MTNTEARTIRNIIARLKLPNCGCSHFNATDPRVVSLNAESEEVVSRIYLDTWIVPALELLLPEQRNPSLAVKLSQK